MFAIVRKWPFQTKLKLGENLHKDVINIPAVERGSQNYKNYRSIEFYREIKMRLIWYHWMGEERWSIRFVNSRNNEVYNLVTSDKMTPLLGPGVIRTRNQQGWIFFCSMIRNMWFLNGKWTKLSYFQLFFSKDSESAGVYILLHHDTKYVVFEEKMDKIIIFSAIFQQRLGISMCVYSSALS